MKYNNTCATFTKIDFESEFSTNLPEKVGDCRICEVTDEEVAQKSPRVIGDPVGNEGGFPTYKSFSIHGETIRIGDAALINPTAYHLPYKLMDNNGTASKDYVVDEDFTEHYRHTKHIKVNFKSIRINNDVYHYPNLMIRDPTTRPHNPFT